MRVIIKLKLSCTVVSVKAIHKSLTSKHKTVRNVSVDNMYLFEYKYMHQEFEQI